MREYLQIMSSKQWEGRLQNVTQNDRGGEEIWHKITDGKHNQGNIVRVIPTNSKLAPQPMKQKKVRLWLAKQTFI